MLDCLAQVCRQALHAKAVLEFYQQASWTVRVGMGRRAITHETFTFVPQVITVAADEPPPAVCFAHFVCSAFCVAGGARLLSPSTSRAVGHAPSAGRVSSPVTLTTL